MKIRVKFGRNPYSNRFACSHCRREFEAGGFFLRIEHEGIIVDIPVCGECFGTGELYEAILDLTENHTAHPISRA